MKARTLTFLILLLIFGCGEQGPYVKIGNEKIMVEIADSDEEKQIGLMFREYLAPERGMLFVWENDEYRSFWMKNTKIPLDMIFISSNGVVVDIITAQPCISDPCQNYPSQEKAAYVLEVNAGFSKEHGVVEGAQVKIAT